MAVSYSNYPFAQLLLSNSQAITCRFYGGWRPVPVSPSLWSEA